MLDRTIGPSSDDRASARWREIKRYAATLHSEKPLDSLFELGYPSLTGDYSKPHISGVALALPSEQFALAGGTATVSHVPLTSVDLGQLSVRTASSSAVFTLVSSVDPWPFGTPSTSLRLVPYGECTFAVTSNDETAFTDRDSSEIQDASVEAMILAVPSSLRAPYARQLARRLMDLHSASTEDEEERELSSASLRWFLAFLRANSGLACPLVGLSAEGNIYATWKRGRDRLLSAHFLPSGEVRFVVFTPTPRRRKSVTRLTGATQVGALLETVRPHGVMSWVNREG